MWLIDLCENKRPKQMVDWSDTRNLYSHFKACEINNHCSCTCLNSTVLISFRRQVQTPSRPSRSLTTLSRVVRRGWYFYISMQWQLCAVTGIFLVFSFWDEAKVTDRAGAFFYLNKILHNVCIGHWIYYRIRKPRCWHKWKCLWFHNKAASPSMASNWKFYCLCCCK